jgi:hypothetical protein
VLEPHEQQAFEGMVARLSADDQRFTRRVDQLGRPPRRELRLVVAVALWILAPVAIWQGGWTGFFLAVVGVAYGVHLVKQGAPLTGRSVPTSPFS